LDVGRRNNIDVAPDGTVYGIELLNANEQLYREDVRNNVSKVPPAKMLQCKT
jgi:uncharacterized protein YuzE